MRRKKSRKKREWNGFPSEEGGRVEVEEEDASTWEYGNGGKKLKACERKRETGYRGYLYRLYLCCFALPLLCNTKPTRGRSNYKIHMWILYIVVLQWQDGVCIVQVL